MRDDIIAEDAAHVASRIDLSALRGKTVLIAGATGMIGRHLVAACNLAGATVHSCSRQDYDLGPNEGCDLVIHAAGYGQPAKFMDDPGETISVNTYFLRELLEGYPTNKTTKFLFLSSLSVYVNAPPPWDENSMGICRPSEPRAGYVQGKLAGEALCHAAMNRGLDCRIARVGLTYGPGVRLGDQRPISQFIESALRDHRIEMTEPGDAIRSWLYVRDCAEMLMNILLYGALPVYNVGGYMPYTTREVAEEIATQTGSILVAPQGREPDTVRPIHLDCGRYFAEFGRPDFMGTREGLRRTIDWTKGLRE